jgi:hypothetical protein
MPRTIARIGCGILILLLMTAVISACAKKPEPEYAASITEGILVAMNDNDYVKYSEHFSEEMKNALPESVFEQANAEITAKIGKYVSAEYLKLEYQDIYTIVYYKANFTQEPEGVTVKVVFQEIDGGIYVAGLWFDSPKLRGR